MGSEAGLFTRRAATEHVQAKRILGLKPSDFVQKLVIELVLTLGAVAVLLPLVWMLSTSLKTMGQVGVYPIQWMPEPVMWSNYPKALTTIDFALYTWNTIKVTFIGMAGVLISCSLAAYGFSRFRAPGLNIMFLLLLSTIMLPSQVTLIPVYIMFSKIKWVDTLKPLIVPTFFGNPYDIFLLRQFFMTIPLEMDDAARIDGCNPLQTFWHVIVPMAKPALGTVAIFHFMYGWNEFFGPLIYLHHRENWTLALGLQGFRQVYSTDTNLLMAASFVAALPCILLFFFAQRQFIQGVVISGVKG
ncbi:MAG: carbohydrate ABC transporter permease [Anaerolineae bacterium]|jgi:multiple sugar transport system permease protein